MGDYNFNINRHRIDIISAAKLTRTEYFITDFCSCNGNFEHEQEIIAFYLGVQDEREIICRYENLGYGIIPHEIKIIKVYDTQEISYTYKRKYVYANIEYDGIVFDAIIMCHKHDGCSDCYDEVVVFVGESEFV
jgi:hypothetical protein